VSKIKWRYLSFIVFADLAARVSSVILQNMNVVSVFSDEILCFIL